MIIEGRERDLGGFRVRRILPYAVHRMVGPFIFFDHMGPANFAVGKGIEVRPHPHIGLATVTYLFNGKIHHCDSLGSDQLIEPGAINWMVAGNGIVHSERTPEDMRQTGSELNGIQCWIALPTAVENTTPSFTHYPKSSIPTFTINKTNITLLLGNMFDHQSPVKVHSPLFYLDAVMPADETLVIPVRNQECAVYVVEGSVTIDSQHIQKYSMYVNDAGRDISVKTNEPTRIMILGGQPVGERFIYWNFVASTEEKITQAKVDWKDGPGATGSRFAVIPTDHDEYIPLPEDLQKNPPGTIM